MDQPLLVTAAIILKNKKVLLIKRGREPFVNTWCFSAGCGAFKYTNDPKMAVQKEVMIDLGLKFMPEFLTCNYEKFEVPTITLFYFGRASGAVKPNSKYVRDYGWFDIEDALKLEMGFDHKKTLQKFQNRAKEK